MLFLSTNLTVKKYRERLIEQVLELGTGHLQGS